ncbi:MAG: hypothetical protein P1V35_11925, partial [Planctomycetota bacterium]|nr:hypothetical protein [Planctomycetota bacterium]
MAVERPPGGRLATASMALAALCFAWGAIALWPFHGALVGDDLRIVVLDSSASVSRIRSGLAGSSAVLLREQARGAQAAGQKFAVITASPQGQRRWGPADPMDFLEGESEGSLRPLRWAPLLGEDLSTDWTGTLALVENLASGDGVAQSQVVLFTDGRASDARAWDSLARLAAKGCVLQYGELPPITGVEVALAGLDVPVECSPGVPGTVRVEMAWRGAAVPPDLTWPWRMEIRDAGGLVHGSEGVWPVDATLQSQGWQRRTQTLPLPALAQGVYGVRVDLNGIAGDRSSENQFQQALLRVGDPLQVLVAGSGGPGLTSES